MYASNALLVLVAAGAASASVMVAERAVLGSIHARSVQNGWSLASSAGGSGLTSCSNGQFCPSGLTCNTAANSENAACCSGSDCRGEVEGAPKCADSSWNLWKGYQGNGFCCLAGESGFFDNSAKIAGFCASGSAPAGAQTAIQMSTGSGAAATSAAPASSSAAAETTAASSAASVASSAASAASSAVSSASSAASSAASAASAATGSSTGSSTSSSSTSSPTAKTGGAAKVAGSFGLAAVGVIAALL